jgi:tRNA(Ile)-lysidine synthase
VTTAATPLDDGEVDALLAALSRHDRIVLAVSGGADSTALMHIVSQWLLRQRPLRLDVMAVTIDHGLRPEAAVEAKDVGKLASSLGIAHRILDWAGPKPSTGIQAAARQARYALLREAATASWRPGDAQARTAIVTAHTADDQAETLLMRLARGSGVDGLAAIPASGTVAPPRDSEAEAGVPILRPLLTVPRARLIAGLEAASIGYSNDPSNLDPRYERVRTRNALRLLEGLGFDRMALARTAARMQDARTVLDRAADAAQKQIVRQTFGCIYEFDLNSFDALPEETAVRLLRRLLGWAGGSTLAAELATIESGSRRLKKLSTGGPTAGRDAFTLGGCIVETALRKGKPGLTAYIYREPDRGDGLPRLDLQPGERSNWDDRFRVIMAGSIHTGSDRTDVASLEPVEVGPLADDWPAIWPEIARACGALAQTRVPLAAVRGLPVFRRRGSIIAIPVLADLARRLGDPGIADLWQGPLVEMKPEAGAGASRTRPDTGSLAGHSTSSGGLGLVPLLRTEPIWPDPSAGEPADLPA